MAMQATKPATVDAYIASFPKEVQERLNGLRALIKKAAPKAEESVSYGLAGYKLHGPVVYFGGFKNHIGVYPAGASLQSLADELVPYKAAKGTLQFPLDEPLPLKLIEKVVKHRVKENEEKAHAKK